MLDTSEERRQAAVVNINIGPGMMPGSRNLAARAHGYQPTPEATVADPIDKLREIHLLLTEYLEMYDAQ